MKLTSMQKIIAAGVAVLVAAVVIVVLLIVPLFNQLSQIEADRQAAEQQKMQAKAVLGQLEDAKGRAATTQSELLRIGTAMPDSPQLPTLIIELQDMANQAGVELNTFAPAPPAFAPGKNFTRIVMTMNVEQAKWSDLLDFMRRLNKSRRLLRVTTVSISRAGTTASADTSAVITEKPATTLNVSLSVIGYVIGNNGVIAPSEAPVAPGAAGATQ